MAVPRRTALSVATTLGLEIIHQESDVMASTSTATPDAGPKASEIALPRDIFDLR